jgi:hypothetical protein
MTTRDPATPDEWQAAVNAAEACLLVDSARQYGLITGGPVVDVARCDEILEQGRARQIVPTKDGVDAYIKELAAPA